MRILQSIRNLTLLLSFGALPAQAQWATDTLSAPRGELSAVTVDQFALFAGGRTGGTLHSTVDIYDALNDAWTMTALPLGARTNLAVAALGHQAFFAGGATAGTASTTAVDIFDSQTQLWVTAQLSVPRFGLVATAVGTKVIFAGGATNGPFNAVVSDVVDIYDSALGLPSDPLAWTATTLTQSRAFICAGTVGQLAMFAGGYDGTTDSNVVDVYDNSTDQWAVMHLSQARGFTTDASAVVGSKIFFAGGLQDNNVLSGVVDIYDEQTGLWTVESLPTPRVGVLAVALGNVILMAGGLDTQLDPVDLVETFNVGTGKWGLDALPSGPRNVGAATVVGDRAFFGGGFIGNGATTSTVDIYQPVGFNYCQAAVNSTGDAATIAASGSTSLTANNLVLSATCLPDKPFLFFHGGAQQQAPFGDGFLCVSGGLVRIMPPGFANDGLGTTAVDLPSVGITSPGERHFQCWFRDPGAGGSGFNTSDAITVTFTP
jgi:hypothetical protein